MGPADPGGPGKSPRQSPSGCGQVVVKVGRLTTVCDDRAALQEQCRIWRSVYDLGRELWQLAPVDSFEPIAESRITERLFQEGRL
ncbi:hypothetical protein E1287_07410 [Actinomadura sp. KC06]|uniref:hypothetical protein n=1 Tax=Actinomadura sp. KC06 TaxID=2530369 RepID=UPI001042900D|nr:hypothetical protein [Actinomadura sp. KC06]TDD37875.1 hypothetical protein E1287_07410 [Actinomadura sp. KC06]